MLEFHAEQAPRCTDGLDNDADGLVDFDDPLCSETWPYWEAPPCGFGTEIALLLPAWPLWRRKRSAQRAVGERSPSGRPSRPSC
ncbi:MAG: hypothetical protein QNK03_04815 [Myxococcota bacterium]|nr:hypothetical protein [Myxococcota bacterium]